MGYELVLNTRTVQCVCQSDINLDVDYIQSLENEYDISWMFDFKHQDLDDYSLDWNGDPRGEKAGDLIDLLKALMFVCMDKQISVTGMIPYTEYSSGGITYGLISMSQDQVSIIRFANCGTSDDYRVMNNSDVSKLVDDVRVLLF